MRTWVGAWMLTTTACGGDPGPARVPAQDPPAPVAVAPEPIVVAPERPAEPELTTVCRDGERIVASCAVEGGRAVSLCASDPLTATEGWMVYRFGTPDAIELEFPATPTHPTAVFTFGAKPNLGHGTEWVRFENGGYIYALVYTWMSGSHDVAVTVKPPTGEPVTIPCLSDPEWNGPALYDVLPNEVFLATKRDAAVAAERLTSDPACTDALRATWGPVAASFASAERGADVVGDYEEAAEVMSLLATKGCAPLL